MGEFVGKEFQSDVATELKDFRFVDHPHPAAADLAENAVVRNCLPHGLERDLHWRECFQAMKGGGNRADPPARTGPVEKLRVPPFCCGVHSPWAENDSLAQ